MTRETPKKETSFEQKLKDIEREKRRLEHEIKSLSKAMKRGELPGPLPATRVFPRPTPLSGARTDTQKAGKDAGSKEASGDLFAKEKEGRAEHVSDDARKPAFGSPLVPEKKMPVYGDKRFTSYFSAGGFKSPMPARQERSIQRNKAIFMVVLVVVVGYVLIRLFFR